MIYIISKYYLWESLIILLIFSILLILINKSYILAYIKNNNLFHYVKLLIIDLLLSIILNYVLCFAIDDIFLKFLIFVLVYLCLIAVYINNKKRITVEKTFDEIIVYSSNLGMLLKQTHNVYSSLDKIKNDFSSDFKKDIVSLMNSFLIDKNKTKEEMNKIEAKYKYSIMQDLNIILFHMFYENSNVVNEQFDSFLMEVSSLENDIKKNKKKRKTMRIQYIGIAIGSFLTYWYFYNSIINSIGVDVLSISFNIINFIFVSFNILSLYLVDSYFNKHTTKE